MSRDFVTRELLLAFAGAATGVLLLSSADEPLASWQVGAAALAVTTATLGVTDHLAKRPAVGLLVAVAASAVALLLFTYPPELAAVAAGMIGMNLGWALERMLFGVVRPVPAPRLARERA